MAAFHSFFSSCVLLLLALNWRTSTALPVRAQRSADQFGDCALGFRNLLLNLTDVQNKTGSLTRGILSVNMMSGQPDTVLACAPTVPQSSSCTTMKKTSYNVSECLRNILKDLDYYAAVIDSYIRDALKNSPTEVPRELLEIIRSLRENCSLMPDGGNGTSTVDSGEMWSDNSFNNRLKMLKMMKGFSIRAITMNRAISYISSGDYSE